MSFNPFNHDIFTLLVLLILQKVDGYLTSRTLAKSSFANYLVGNSEFYRLNTCSDLNKLKIINNHKGLCVLVIDFVI